MWRETISQTEFQQFFRDIGLTKKEIEFNHLSRMLTIFGCEKFTILPREKPDFAASISLPFHEINVAIEITELYSEVKRSKGAVDQNLWGEWERFASDLSIRLSKIGEEHLFGAVHLYGSRVTFGKPQPNRLRSFMAIDRERLQDEILSLVENRPKTALLTDFEKEIYPTLYEHVDKIWTVYVKDEISPRWWLASLQTGLNKREYFIRSLQQRIKDKAEKSLKFDWPDTHHRCLFIAATERGVTDRIHYLDRRMIELFGFPEINLSEYEHTFTTIALIGLRSGIIAQLFPVQRLISGLTEVLGLSNTDK